MKTYILLIFYTVLAWAIWAGTRNADKIIRTVGKVIAITIVGLNCFAIAAVIYFHITGVFPIYVAWFLKL